MTEDNADKGRNEASDSQTMEIADGAARQVERLHYLARQDRGLTSGDERSDNIFRLDLAFMAAACLEMLGSVGGAMYDDARIARWESIVRSHVTEWNAFFGWHDVTLNAMRASSYPLEIMRPFTEALLSRHQVEVLERLDDRSGEGVPF